jgi:TPR repeat protein
MKKPGTGADDGRASLEQGCDYYLDGKFKEAFEQFHRAAIDGNLQAQVNLGNLFDAGEGVEKNFPAAVRWYKTAVKAGSAEAAFNLAMSYRNRGQNRWAKFWLEKASQLGDTDAVAELAKLK